MTDQLSTDQVWDNFTIQLRRFIANRVRNETDAQDILQEVFIKIHRGIDKLEDQLKLQAWVYQITRNAIIDYYRKSDDTVEATDELLQDGEFGFAALNLAASNFFGLLLVWAGYTLAKVLQKETLSTLSLFAVLRQ